MCLVAQVLFKSNYCKLLSFVQSSLKKQKEELKSIWHEAKSSLVKLLFDLYSGPNVWLTKNRQQTRQTLLVFHLRNPREQVKNVLRKTDFDWTVLLRHILDFKSPENYVVQLSDNVVIQCEAQFLFLSYFLPVLIASGALLYCQLVVTP